MKETLEKVRMIALRKTYYAGRDIKAGESFEVSPEHVHLLTSVKSAKLVEESKRTYKRRDMRAED